MCCKRFIIGGLLYCTIPDIKVMIFWLFLMGTIVTWKITILISKAQILVSGCNWYHNLYMNEVIYSGEGVQYGVRSLQVGMSLLRLLLGFMWRIFYRFIDSSLSQFFSDLSLEALFCNATIWFIFSLLSSFRWIFGY